MRVTNEARAGQLLQGCVTTVAVAAVLSAAGATELPTTAGGAADPEPDGAVEEPGTALWQESWSERYPGCVALVLWPDGERPVALVTRSPDGGLHRVPVGTGRRVPSGDLAVGACR